MYYWRLKTGFIPSDRKIDAIDNLKAIRTDLIAQIPPKDLEENLLLATWNIRDFGKKGGFNPGPRRPESLYYIAQILSSFDLIAVQEVNELDDLECVLSIMGPSWDYIATDVSDRKAGGNGERMTFIFDKRKIWFQKIAGEIVLPSDLLISKVEIKLENGQAIAGKQFRRTPYIVSFQCGWFKFDLCTVHLYYGEETGPALEERIEEINAIASYLSKRANKEFLNQKSLILLGDFNIVSVNHDTMNALTKNGFVVPKALQLPTAVHSGNYYDQIAFKTHRNMVEYIDGIAGDGKANAGAFNIFKSVFTKEKWKQWESQIAADYPEATEEELENKFSQWRTWQLSDHNLLWCRLKINDSDNYLNSLKAALQKLDSESSPISGVAPSEEQPVQQRLS